MKILFVTQFFYPENFRINDLAQRLTDRGHSVTVLTGMPNYPSGDIYEGYSFFRPVVEMWGKVRILRVPVIPRKKGGLFLCLNYLSFIVSGCLKALFMKEDDFDVIYAFGTSPITQALPALVMKRRRGAGVLLNVQDLWPDNVTAITGLKDPLALRMLDAMVDFIYNRADVILCTSVSFVKAIRARKGLRVRRKAVFWPQYATVKRSSEIRRDLLGQGAFHIVFTGNVGYGQGLDLVVDAAAILKERGISSLVFDIFGDGRARDELQEKVEKEGLSGMVVFHGRVPEEEIPGILNTADAALLILKRDPIFERTIPAKLQTYLTCGTPVLGCVEGESRSLILRSRAGMCTGTMTASSLARTAAAMARLDEEALGTMGRNALRVSEEMFDDQKLVDLLEECMERVGRC